MYQPPEPSSTGHCLRCASCIDESEQVDGICYDCQPVEVGHQPAFPVQASEYGGHGTCFGLTIRDYFAAKALQGLLAWPGDEGSGSYHSNSDPKHTASMAYEYADAMLSARGGS